MGFLKLALLKCINELLLFLEQRGISELKNFYLLPKKKVQYAENGLYTVYNSDFTLEPKFDEAYRLGKETDGGHLLRNTDIRWRIHVLCWAAHHVQKLEGDFVDCGVSTGIFPRAVMHYIDFEKTDKTYYLLDTFSGLDPRYSTANEMKYDQIIGYKNKEHGYEKVVKTFSGYTNVKIIKGAIPETLNHIKTKKVCYLSIDMNCVLPEIEALEFFWEKLVSGAIIILDDYGSGSHLEQKKAHNEFAQRKKVKILTLPTCQGIIIKP